MQQAAGLKDRLPLGLFYDMFGGGPYSCDRSSARIELLENASYNLRSQDVFSKEQIELNGTIRKCDRNISQPSLVLELQSDLTLTAKWLQHNAVDLQDQIRENQLDGLPFNQSIVRQSSNLDAMRIAFRQRPEKFTTGWYVVDFQREQYTHFLFACSKLLPPDIAWDCTLFLYTDMTIDSANTWRDTFDLREVPGFESPNSILWIEVERNGQYKLAWKRHPETSERQLREQLQRDELEPPQDWLVRQAQPHDELTLVSLHRSNQTKIPDLRFDDEIAQQKQKP